MYGLRFRAGSMCLVGWGRAPSVEEEGGGPGGGVDAPACRPAGGPGAGEARQKKKGGRRARVRSALSVGLFDAPETVCAE
jgi:hypothetical protein